MLAAAIWHNVLQAADVDNDGQVIPLDALRIINELNGRRYSESPDGRLVDQLLEDDRPPFYDVNCDGHVRPFDALRVINVLNGSNSVQGWRFDSTAVADGVIGNYTAAGCFAQLIEGDSFRTELVSRLKLPSDASGVRLKFDTPEFDTASSGTMQDAFEVTVTDFQGNPLVSPYRTGRTASMNWSEATVPATGDSLKLTGDTETSAVTHDLVVDLSHLPRGTEVMVTARLINNDRDNATSVVLRELRTVSGPFDLSPQPAGEATSALGEAAPVDLGRLQDLSGSLQASYGRTSYTADRSQVMTELVVTNLGRQAVTGQLVVVMDRFSDLDTFVMQPDGILPDGRPFFDMTSYLDGPLAPGESTPPRPLRFTNPGEQRFDYRLTTLGSLNNAPGAITTTPVDSIEARRTYRYQPSAVDPDDQALTYSLITGPESMQVDSLSGEMVWETTDSDIGNHAVIVRATDPYGLFVEQSFTIQVVATLQNRPPNFITDPVTEAIASAGFEITTVATGNGPAGVTTIGGFTGPRLVSINAGEQTVSVHAGRNNDRFDDVAVYSTGEPRPDKSLFDVGYAIDIGLPDFLSRSDTNAVLGMDQADFNGDGILDIAAYTTHRHSFNVGGEEFLTITRMLGDGDGGFGEPEIVMQITPPNNSDARNLVAADINGDGAIDLLALERRAATLYTILGNGDGTFQPATATLYDDAQVSDFRVVDVDGDGNLDLIGRTAQLGFGANYDSMWMRGAGDGTFSDPITIDADAGSAPNCCYQNSTRPYDTADLNGDGHLDLVISGRSGSNIAIYLSDGTGNFTLEDEIDPPGSAFSSKPDWLSVEDFTGDGHPDVAFVHIGEKRLSLLVGDGTGTNFEYRQGSDVYMRSDNWSGSDHPMDIDGDGDLDIILTSWGSPVSPQVLINDGNGNFTTTIYPIVDFPGQITEFDQQNFEISRGAMFGDYNRDGVVDFTYMTAGIDFNGIGIRLGTRPGEFGGTRTIPFTDDRFDDEALVGDLDNDGNLDLLSFRSSQTLLGNGDGTFQPAFPAAPLADSPGLLVDFDLDGVLDFVATPGSHYRVALGNGDGTFTLKDDQQGEGMFHSYNYIDIADFNGDGHPDFIAKAAVERHIDVYLNQPDDPGTFLRSFRTTTSNAGINISHFDQAVTIGDFNDDGHIDIAAGDQDENGLLKLMLFVGDGTGNFELESESFIYDDDLLFVPFYYTGDMSSGDFNEDGNRDIVSFTTQGPMIHLGDGQGNFITTDLYPPERSHSRGRDGHVFDIDEDGHLDLIETGGPHNENLIVRRGRGDGTFEDPLRVGLPGRTTQLTFADIDHDGHLDVTSVVGQPGGGAFDVHVNNAVIYAGKRDGLIDIHTADLNGDGNQEVLAVNENNDRLKLFVGDNLGNLTRQPDLLTGRASKAVITADLDGDGQSEILTANRTGRSLSLFSGSLQSGYSSTEIAIDGRPIDLATADLNDDGLADLVVLDDASNALWLFSGNGSTALDAPTAIALGDKPARLALGDATGDGKIDAVVTLTDSSRLMILGDIGGEPATPIYINLSSPAGDVAVSDLNQDGIPDVIASLPEENAVSIHYGRGGGQFSAAQNIAVGERPTRLSLADADEDGRLDILVANQGDDTLSVIYNRFDPNEVYRYDADAIDPDDDPLVYSIVDGPGGLIIKPETGEMLWAASPDQVGVHDVTIQADDGRGGIATQSFKIDVQPPRDNAAPVIATAPQSTLGAGETFDYQVTALDNDHDALRYRLLEGPEGAELDPTTGKLTWDGREQGLIFGLNGRGGDVRIPADPSLQPASITVEGWYNFHRLPASNGASILMRQHGSRGQAYYLANVFNRALRLEIQFDDFTKNLRFEVPFQPETDRWYHIALTIDDGTREATIYADGAFLGSTPIPDAIAYRADADSQIGEGGINPTQATVDNYRIWNVARSAAEIREGMERQYDGDPRLVLDYRFEGPNTRTVRDSSIYGNDGYRFNSGLYPSLRTGLTDPGNHTFVIGVEDGRGGFDTQAFDLTVVPELRGAIEGRLFDDLNGDGGQDDGSEEGVPAEPPLEGWQLFIDTNGNHYPDPDEAIVTTDADGQYRFEGLLPGAYPVRVTPTAGYREPEPFEADVVANQVLANDLAIEQLSLSQLRGQLTNGDAEPLADWPVFVDLDRDGVRDQDEPVALSDRQGNYAVTGLEAGEYTIRPDLPAGWLDAVGRDGLQVKLAADEVLGGNDFLLQPANTSVTGGVRFVTQPTSDLEARQIFRYASLARTLRGEAVRYDLPLAPEGMTVDPHTGLVAWRPAIGQVGEQPVIIRATGADGSIAMQDFTLVVTAPNVAPLISQLRPSSGYVDVAYRYDVKAQDAEGEALTFTLIEGPSTASLHPTTGRLSWLPAASDAGANDFTIRVSDASGGETTVSFAVEIAHGTPAVLPLAVQAPRAAFPVGRLTTGRISASDQLGRPIDWSLEQGPSGLSVAPDGTFQWSPSNDQLGVHPVELTATMADGDSELVLLDLRVVGSLRNSAPAIESTPSGSAVLGGTYRYDVIALDPDADPLSFALLEAPTGMSIDPRAGTIRWIPADDQLGEQDVVLRVADTFGSETAQRFTVHARRAGGPPRITSVPPTEGSVGLAFLYSVTAKDAEGDPLMYRLLAAPFGMTLDPVTGELSWTPTSDQLGQQAVAIEVSDGAGGATTQSFAILVSEGAPNLTPEISSTAPRFAAAGTDYLYATQAHDPEGTSLSYSLSRGPAGMEIDAATGALSWTPEANQAGKHIVTIRVTDQGGASAIESFELDVLAENHDPQIDSVPPADVAAGAAFQYDVLASDPDLDQLRFTLLDGPDGVEIDPFGRIRWQTSVDLIGSHDFEVLVSDPRGGETRQSFALDVVEDIEPPRVSIIESPGDATRNILPWQGPFTVFVRAIDNVAVASMTLQANGQDILLDASGRAQFTFEDWGFAAINATATAIDTNGNVTTRTITFDYDFPEGWSGAGTEDIPTAIISSPSDTETVFGMVSIIGTAAHENFAAYKLSYRRVDETSYTEFLQSDTPVTAGELGVWDTSLLINDEYVIRLEVATSTGVVNVVEHNVGLAGELKLGNFRLSFTDMVIPVAGIPIEITRIYDTLQADREGDFGFGWRLEYRNTDLRVGLPKSGLEDIGIYSPLRPGVKIFLNVPGQGRQGFTFNPDIRVLPGWGGNNLVLARPRFTPDPGVTSTLSTGTSSYLQVNEQGELYAPGNIPYNPASPDFGGAYVLTTRDGSTYRISGNSGKLTQASDLNNNRIDFGDDGVDFDSERMLSIERDSQKRIVAIVGRDQQALRYRYDAKGDLASIEDQLGSRASFAYETGHVLAKVFDATGNVNLVAEYAPDGRIVGIQDGSGETVSFQHSSGRREETRTSRGIAVKTLFDALGNPIREERKVTIEGKLVDVISESQYDEYGRLLVEIDADGIKTVHRYDSVGNPTGSDLDPGGVHQSSLQFVDRNGRPTAAVDARGNRVAITYDQRGNIATTLDASGNQIRYQVDDRGNWIERIETNGVRTKRSYSREGWLREEQTYSRDGSLVTKHSFDYDPMGRETSSAVWVEDVARFTRRRYDVRGNLIEQIRQDGAVKSYAYDSLGNLASETDYDGAATSYEYDSSGNRTRSISPSGSITEYAYDGLGNLTSKTYPTGTIATFAYDELGRQVSSTISNALQQEQVFSPGGRVLAVVDSRGNRTNYDYDSAGRLREIVSPAVLDVETATLGRPAHRFERDFQGRVTKRTDPKGNISHTIYDEAGRRVSEVFADNTSRRWAYDSVGNVVLEVAPNGHSKRFDYNEKRQLVAVHATDGPQGSLVATTQYEYDALGALLRQTDAMGRQTTYAYDSLGRLVEKRLPLGQTERYTLDASGNVLTHTDFNGKTGSFVYDAENRRVEEQFESGASEQHVFDTSGRLTAATNASGTVTFAYDDLDRIVSYQTASERSLSYQYDPGGLVTAVSIDGMQINSYSYDALGRLDRASSQEAAAEYAYDLNGNVVKVVYENGIIGAITYDSMNRPLTIRYANAANEIVASVVYRYNQAGERSGITTGSNHISYQYDAQGRVIVEEWKSIASGVEERIEYTYDLVGNRTSVSRNGVEERSVYDENDRLVARGASQYTYSEKGERLSESGAGGTTVFVWAEDGTLQSVTKNGLKEAFTYDALANRISETAGGTTKELIVDLVNPTGHSQVIQSRGSNGVIVTNLVGLNPIATTGEETIYVHSDAIGSVRTTSDGLGATAEARDYEAFGVSRSSVATPGVGFGFAGERQSELSGLYHLRAREYDPQAGVFLTQDPLSGALHLPLTQHDYAYALNDPISRIDPSGEASLLSLTMGAKIRVGILLTTGLLAPASFKFKASFAVASSGIDPLALPALAQDRRAATEAMEIIRLFYEWYDLIEPELQSASTLGWALAGSGQNLACGAHATELHHYIQLEKQMEFEKFEFTAYNEYYYNNGPSDRAVAHTYLVGHWDEGEVALNLDSWKYDRYAPRIPWDGPSEGSTTAPEALRAVKPGETRYVSPGGRRSCPVPLFRS